MATHTDTQTHRQRDNSGEMDHPLEKQTRSARFARYTSDNSFSIWLAAAHNFSLRREPKCPLTINELVDRWGYWISIPMFRPVLDCLSLKARNSNFSSSVTGRRKCEIKLWFQSLMHSCIQCIFHPYVMMKSILEDVGGHDTYHPFSVVLRVVSVGF